MRFDNSEGILTIFLEGDIDAQNAADIQQEIVEIIESQGEAALVFDARELVYISSAGLCVILCIQKELGGKFLSSTFRLRCWKFSRWRDSST